MKHTLLSLMLAAGLMAASPSLAADCFADYKAKQDNPLRLHYGVIKLAGPCQPGPARQETEARLAGAGWTLLKVLSVFGPEGLEQRKANAGPYYLRY